MVVPGIPLVKCMHMFYEKFSLDRGLNDLFVAIKNLQAKPPNPLYSHLPTTIQLKLADLPISMVLSPQTVETDEDWAHWEEMDDLSSSGDEESDIALDEMSKQPDLRIEPWQTLLLVDEDLGTSVDDNSTDLTAQAGRGGSMDESEDSSLTPLAPRGPRETGFEEDEGVLMRSLINACDVSKP